MIIYDYINSDVQLLGILPGGKDSPVASALFHIVSSEKNACFYDSDFWIEIGTGRFSVIVQNHSIYLS